MEFRDDWLRAFFVEAAESYKVPADIDSRLFRKLPMIQGTMTAQDLRVSSSSDLKKLRGNLEGWYSIRVNKQWRVIFRWNGGRGAALDIYLDNHSYR